MIRAFATGSFCVSLACALSGCTSFFTAQAIDSFTSNLASSNLDGLRESSSTAFQQSALRLPGSVDSLATLPLPKEEGEIVEIEEVSEDEQLITVQVGDQQQTVQYRLTRDSEAEDKSARAWKVDDVILTQQRPGQSEAITKSVSEQMDLLLTVREFLAHWSTGSRDEVLAELHPDFAATLGKLSPTHLAQVTNLMLDGVDDDRFRPEVRMQETRAAVLVPRRNGKLEINLALSDSESTTWQVTEVLQQSSRDEQPAQSASQLAECLGAASEFLQAYARGDRARLGELSSAVFYDQALSAGDLASVPIPVEQLLATPYELEQQGLHSDLLFAAGENTYLVSLIRDKDEEVVLPGDERPAPQYRVAEVTIYERGGAQIKPLSSLFTAQAVVEIFAEALAARDVTLLKQLSSGDLNERVWNRLADAEVGKQLPIQGIPNTPPRVVTSVFQGAVTEMTVTQGSRALTYVLYTEQGRTRVDDVLMPSHNRPASLKTTLESIVPVYNFVWAWEQQRVDLLSENSSSSMRRMVWIQARDTVPKVNAPLRQYLNGNLMEIEDVEGERRVKLGSAARNVQVRLVNQEGRLLVETIALTGSTLPGGQLELVSAMRDWLATKAGMSPPPKGRRSSRVTFSTPLATVRTMVDDDKPAAATTAAVEPEATAADQPLLQRPIAIPGVSF
jgi:hypothetical protein